MSVVSVISEACTILFKKNAEEFRMYYDKKDVRSALDQLKSSKKCSQEILDEILKFSELCAKMDSEFRSDKELYDVCEDFIYPADSYTHEVIDELDEDITDNPGLWSAIIELTVLCIRSGSPPLLYAFSDLCRSKENLALRSLDLAKQIQLLEALLSALPHAVANPPKTKKPNHVQKADAEWTNTMFQLFQRFCEDLGAKKFPLQLQPHLSRILAYATDRLLESPYENDEEDDYNIFGNIFLTAVGELFLKNVDLCVGSLRSLEILSKNGVDDNINTLVSLCLRNITEQRGSRISSKSVQAQVDAFLKDDSIDQLGNTPNMLLNVYEREKELVHRNLAPLAAKMLSLEMHKAINIAILIKEVAKANPHAVDDQVISRIYPALCNQSMTTFMLEALTSICHVDATRISAKQLFPAAEALPVYVPTICQLLALLGTSDKTKETTATEILQWLITQCQTPPLMQYGPAMLATAKAIGFKHRNSLLPLKPQLEVLEKIPTLKEATTTILDFVEGRSLAGVSQAVDEQADQIDKVTDDVANINSEVQEVKITVEKQSDDIDNLQTDMENQKNEVKVIRAELEGAIIEIEKIDRKTVDTTPTWSHDVAKLLNPECEADWRLMAKRLGYTNDDLKSWASHSNPCMTALVEWFATHKSSEATRAVYIVLKEMNREDAGDFVARAMKEAGEMVPDDTPLDLEDPPSVFISYQWGVQDKAKELKDYVTDAGFKCWMDIGQMGGGDKLYEKIDTGIRAAKLIICLVTEKYAKSPNCNKEVNLSVSLGKPIIPLLMEKMSWPPPGSMGPIFGEYLFIRFFQRESEKKEGIYWPIAKMDELLIQVRYTVEPDAKLVTKCMDDWWIEKTGCSIKNDETTEETSDGNPEVFISYQWGKQKEVITLYNKLTSMGYRCWLDIHQMGGGDSLYDKIDRGLRGCQVIVSCITEKYALSLNCRREISLADAIKKPIIPLLLEDMSWPPSGPMSMPLSQLEYINFVNEADLISGGKFNELLHRLAECGIGNVKATSDPANQKSNTPFAQDHKCEPKTSSNFPGKAAASPSSKAETPQVRNNLEKPKSSSCNIL